MRCPNCGAQNTDGAYCSNCGAALLTGELPEADTFAVIGATAADNFGVSMPEGTIGTSLLEKIQ